MEVTKYGQVFYEQEANEQFPQGCTCPDRSGSCDWCHVYYNGLWEALPIIDILRGVDDAICLIGQAQVQVVMGADDPWRRLQRVKEYLNKHYTALSKMYFDGKVPAMQ